MDQVPLPRSNSLQNGGESGRYSPSQAAHQVPQAQLPDSTDEGQPEPFKAPYDPPQPEPRVQLEPPQVETGTQEDSLKYGVQEKNTATRSGLLAVPKDSPLMKRHWLPESPESDSDDPLEAIEKMNKALVDLVSVRHKLQHCLKENERELELTKEDLKICQQEREEYKQKCTTLVETEKQTRVYYKDKLGVLEKQLEDLSEVREEADRKHEQDEAIFKQTLKIQTGDYTELKREFGKQRSELEDVESRYKAKQADVEQLRESLRQREEELGEMGKELTTRTAQLQELERQTKVLTISQEKETTEEQLQRCQQIRELVERLPQVTTQEDLEAITKQISEDITRMKATTTRRKAISWR